MTNSACQVPKKMLETCPISGGGSAHGLARAVDQKGDVRSGDNEILEGADYTAVDSGIGRDGTQWICHMCMESQQV